MYPHGCRLLIDALNGKHVDFEAEFGRHYDALVDINYSFDEIFAQVPDAKVVLTVRDDMEKWWNSYSQGVAFINLFRMQDDSWKKVPDHELTAVDHAGLHLGQMFQLNEGGKFSKSRAIEYHRHYVEHVKATVPRENLLVFRPSEGWGPLCRFLGKPEPDEPFPHVNELGAFQSTAGPILGKYVEWLGLSGLDELVREYAWKEGVDYESEGAE
ncbi:hypothetical protein DFJ74DRAFT_110472 [Hyaloraphidium curvatum]|nr:hypothetical protein DFJ74DRAFT_110472 [Hyaloraphidium curvatum]